MKRMNKLCGWIWVALLTGLMLIGCDEVRPTENADAETDAQTVVSEESEADKPSGQEPTDEAGAIYAQALGCLERGEIEEAYDLFLSIPDYRDVSEYLERFVYRYGKEVVRGSASTAISYYQYNQYGQNIGCYSGSTYVTNKAYDDGGRLLYEIDSVGNKESYTYDERGFLIKREHYDLYYNRITYYDTYSYREDGQILEKRYICEGTLSSRTTYEYDEAGRLTCERYYYNGVEQRVTVFSYVDSGNLISQKSSQNGPTRYLTQYEYNEKGLPVLEETTSSDLGMTERITMEYDANGNLTRRTYQYRDAYIQEYLYEYNDLEQCIKVTWTDSANPPETVAYEYDKNGNVTRKTWHRYLYNGSVHYYAAYDYFDYRLYYNPVSENEPYADTPEDEFGGK